MSTYASYPAGGGQYYDYPQQSSYAAPYNTQSGYTLEPHPYADAYTAASNHLAADYHESRSRRSSASPASSGNYSYASSSGHGSGHRRRRSSQVYLEEPRRMAHSSSSSSSSRRDHDRDEAEAKEERRRRRREEKAAAASTSAKAMPIPLPRSSTMPTGHTITPSHQTRGRRPVIMSEFVDGAETSARMPIGPVDVLEHASSSSRRHGSRRYSTSAGTRHEEDSRHRHERRSSGSPQGYASGEDEADRRRANRRSHRAEVRQGPGFATSAPDFNFAYGTSPSPYASSFASTAGSHYSATPAADEATKTLRWADQERRAQNDRISSRPKRHRSDSTSSAKAPGEVKGILKNSPNTSRPTSSSGPRRGSTDADLAAGIERMNTADKGESDYRRLKDRFSMPRRHSTFGPGAGSRDRTEYWSEGGRERRYYH